MAADDYMIGLHRQWANVATRWTVDPEDPLVIHVVLTNTLGEAVGRARIDVHEEVAAVFAERDWWLDDDDG